MDHHGGAVIFPFAKLNSCASLIFSASLLFLFSSAKIWRSSSLAKGTNTTACFYAAAPLKGVFEQFGENLFLGSIFILGLSDSYREIV